MNARQGWIRIDASILGAPARLGAAASLVVLAIGCNEYDRMDTSCTPADPSIDQSEDCIRADGRGPLVGAQCIPIQEAPGSDPSWTEVEALLLDVQRGACTEGGSCHGDLDGGSSGIHLPPEGGQALYDALTSTTGTLGAPYLTPGDPNATWMHCNVRNRNFAGIVGVAMPQTVRGLPDDADVLLIEDWILQGAKGPND